VDGADHRPFGLHLLDSPQEELAEPSRLLDLSEYRLDHLLAQAVAAAMAGAPEPAGHPGEKRAGFGRPLRGSGLAAVLLSSGCDVAFDPSPAQRAKIGGRAVACIGRYFVRIAAQIGLDSIEQRSELVLIAAIVAERVRHNDLRVSVDRGLCIVALDVAVLGLEDAAFGIGEVALRFRFWCCRRRRFARWSISALRVTGGPCQR
jgi:hypothetical protein